MKSFLILAMTAIIFSPAVFGRADTVSSFVNCEVILALDANQKHLTKSVPLSELKSLAKRRVSEIELVQGGRKEYVMLRDRNKKTHTAFRLERVDGVLRAVPFESDMAFRDWLVEGKQNLATLNTKPRFVDKIRRWFSPFERHAEPVIIDGGQIMAFSSRLNPNSQFWFNYFLDSVSQDTLASISFILAQGRASRLAMNITWALTDTHGTDLFTTELSRHIWSIAGELGFHPRLTQQEYRYFEIDGFARGVSSIHAMQNGDIITLVSDDGTQLNFKIIGADATKRSQTVRRVPETETPEDLN